ncbi:hypothetical protein CEXT_42861 [Caerostris extrusa]|uniref:Uncharacterized protein n=1 Tax=Caerostris extrusa TaxID=172846 RepID=A0AAV4TX85_CAEEX|nr:hypothetical protein CEXT_42861 [Caerostris extrusa]
MPLELLQAEAFEPQYKPCRHKLKLSLCLLVRKWVLSSWWTYWTSGGFISCSSQVKITTYFLHLTNELSAAFDIPSKGRALFPVQSEGRLGANG